MFLKSLEKALKGIIFSPQTLIPLLVVVLVSFVSVQLTSWVLERPLTDIFLYYETMGQNNLLYLFLTQYPFEIATMIITGIIILFVTVVALMSLAHFASGKKFIKAVNDAVMEWKKSLALTIVAIIIGFLLLVAFFVINFIFDLLYSLGIEALNSFLALILMPLIIVIIGIILTIKFAFVLPAMIKEKPKKALQKSWDFTNNKFWLSFVFVLVLGIIVFLLWSVIPYIGFLLGIDIIFDLIGEILAVTFFGLAISYYYIDN